MNDLSVSVSTAGAHVAHVALPEAAPKVTARNLNFYYGEHHALKNINLTLGTNRVTAFIGPSGCGKSTLLRIFNRMYDLYPGQRATGQLMLDQTNVLDPKLDLNLLRARVGMLKPGFFDHVQKMSLLLKQKLASVVDRYPSVLSEVRGEGLLVGVKAVVPSGDLVNALREQKLLTVGAGDNVVRFLAPLIVNEAEIDQSIVALERACVALSATEKKKAAG